MSNVAVLLRACVAGVIAGLVGAAIWATISYYTGFEIGYAAWGIGLIVGVAVAAASEGGTGLETGVIAVVIAVASVVGGKYAASHMLIRQAMADTSVGGVPNDELLISFLAEGIWSKKSEAGLEIEWSEDMSADLGDVEADFPPEIWSEAVANWHAMTIDEQETMREQFTFDAELMSANFTLQDFKNSFGVFDWIFFLLAAATAFQIGGNMGDD